jgi:hypothetical protein
MKYNVQLLYYDTRFTLWQVEMRALLAQASYKDALDRFVWIDKEKRKNSCTTYDRWFAAGMIIVL